MILAALHKLRSYLLPNNNNDNNNNNEWVKDFLFVLEGSTPTGLAWDTNIGRSFIVLEHQYGGLDVMRKLSFKEKHFLMI